MLSGMVAAVLLAAWPAISRASDYYWTNTGTAGNFTNAANWGPSFTTVPGAADNANFTNSSSTVNWTCGATNTRAVFNTINNTTTLGIGADNTWLVTDSFIAGQTAGRNASVTHSSGNLAVSNEAGTAQMIIGQAGKGSYALSSTLTGTLFVNQLLVTNNVVNGPTNANFIFNGGTLITRAAPDQIAANIVVQSNVSYNTAGNWDIKGDWFMLGGTNIINMLYSSVGAARGYVYIGGGTGTQVKNKTVSAGRNAVLNLVSGMPSLTSVNNTLAAVDGGKIYCSNIQFGGVSNSVQIVGTGSVVNVTAGWRGIGGSYGSVIVSNGGAIYSTGGFQVEGTGTVVVTDAGSYFTFSSGNLVLGQGSNSNSFNIVNGGTVLAPSSTVIGGGAGGTVIGNSLTVTGANSSLTNRSGLTMGDNSANIAGRVLISNGGRVINVGGGTTIGTGAAGSVSNSVTVTGSGSMLSNNTSVTVGNIIRAHYNSLNVLDGGLVMSASGVIGGGGSSATSNNVAIVSDSGSLWTNSGSLAVGAAANAGYNKMLILNGAQVASVAGIIGTNALGNAVALTNGAWNLGSGQLQIGAGSGSGNYLQIDQGSTADNIGTLTVKLNNSINLLGGTLGMAGGMYNGSFTAGDGVQAATLKALGGTLVVSNGLVIPNNATLTGTGGVSGGGTGVSLASGATINPGISGAGALTISGSSLTWGGGSVYRCGIADVSAAPGSGWDFVNVSSQLVLGVGAVIKVDSMGAAPANWSATANYNLRILNYGSLVGSPTNVTVDSGDFTPGGTWILTNVYNALFLLYRGSGVSYSPSSKWNDPNSGNWDVAGNWTPNGQPVNDGTVAMEFAGATAYRSTNNLGSFALNKLLLTGMGGAGITNVIAGNTLVFTNTDARVDYSGSASYRIDCPSQFKTNMVMDGDGYGNGLGGGASVTFTNIAATGGLTKKGPWKLTLNGVNTFGGPLLVDSQADGVLKVEVTNAAMGTVNDVIVSNGTLWCAPAGGTVMAMKNNANRRGLVTGANSVWTNSSSFTVAAGSTTETTNCLLTVTDGGTLYAGGVLTVGDSCPRNIMIVTNGGKAISSSCWIGNAGAGVGNIALVTGVGSVWSNGAVTIGGSGGANILKVERGGVYASASSILVQNLGSVSAPSYLIVTNGGVVNCLDIQLKNDSANDNKSGKAIITGANSLFKLGGGVSQLVRYAGRESTLTVSDGGTVTNGRWTVAYGPGVSACGVIVTNGGRMFCVGTSTLTTTNGCSELFFAVSGTNSLWNNGGGGLNLVNGAGGASTLNGVTVNDGATMINVGTINLATAISIGSSNNYVLVDGGTLQATMLTCSNGAPNGATFTGSSSVTITNIVLANSGQTVTFNGGRLNVQNAVISNGVAQVAGDGIQSAVLNLIPGGTNTFSDGLVITNNAMLGGSGLIAAPSTVYGTLSLGLTGAGTLTNNGTFTMMTGSESRFDVVATTAAGCDLLAVTNGALTLAGTLTPVLKADFVPAKADRFLIMTNQSGSVSGSFANGTRATIYAENLTTKVGTFKIEQGAQGVVLTDYQVWKSGGALLIIR
jgi:T5SS/PEP-CTERM-associated repeat protein